MAAETQIPAEAPNGGEKQERPQSALSKIFNAVKWCAKWAMVIAGVAIIIYNASALSLDVTEEGSVAAAARAVEAEHGRQS